jgi:hypothetical protein
VAVAGLLLTVVAAACTADPEAEPGPEPVPSVEPSSSTAPALTVEPGPLEVRVVRVRGGLPKQRETALRRSLERSVGRWMAAGFTAGPLPRTNFSAAYATYTDGAARQARRQSAVTTNVSLGRELVELVPTRRVARVSALAVGGRPVGASAQVLLVVVGAREDGSQVELVVRGTLKLTPAGRGWKVFGFDLLRSVGGPGRYATSTRRARERERGKGRAERSDRDQRQRPGGRSR